MCVPVCLCDGVVLVSARCSIGWNSWQLRWQKDWQWTRRRSGSQEIAYSCCSKLVTFSPSLSPSLPSLFSSQNNRHAEMLTVHFHPERVSASVSRSCPLPPSLDPQAIVRGVWAAMCKGHSTPRSVDPAGTTPLGWCVCVWYLSLQLALIILVVWLLSSFHVQE